MINQNYLLFPLLLGGFISLTAPVKAEQNQLFIAYPPNNHQTTAEQIFIIGSAPSTGQLTINNQPVPRSSQGNFAPSFPLKLGENIFQVSHNNRVINIKVNRIQSEVSLAQGSSFIADSLTPISNISILPNKLICFQAIALNNTQVSVSIANQNIKLLPNNHQTQLPDNKAVLIENNQAIINNNQINYSGCTQVNKTGNLGTPVYTFINNSQTVKQESKGTINILDPSQLKVIKVISDAGVARTGPSTNHSRLTPLPKGTIATVIGEEGDWLELDYGAWIRNNETQIIALNNLPHSIIRSITSRQVNNETEIIFPLSIPVPITIEQGEKSFTLKLHNITAQTDTIKLNDDPIIKRLDWQQKDKTIAYNFQLKNQQLWGYSLRYEGTNLILSFRHPPKLNHNLQGISILIDPGHGGNELGAVGPTGYPEKSLNLEVSLLLKRELETRGIKVYLTRENDQDVSLGERVEMINQIKPTLALSVHYNALPDGGDAINTKGMGMFWYHPQSHNLAVFLHNYLVDKLNRPSYGVFWNNLALTRPYTTPSVLMELGFIINPDEFEWITDKNEQQKLVKAIADALVEWLNLSNSTLD